MYRTTHSRLESCDSGGRHFESSLEWEMRAASAGVRGSLMRVVVLARSRVSTWAKARWGVFLQRFGASWGRRRVEGGSMMVAGSVVDDGGVLLAAREVVESG